MPSSLTALEFLAQEQIPNLAVFRGLRVIRARKDIISAVGPAWLVGAQTLAREVRHIARGVVRYFPLHRCPLDADQVVTESYRVRLILESPKTSMDFSYAVHLRGPN